MKYSQSLSVGVGVSDSDALQSGSDAITGRYWAALLLVTNFPYPMPMICSCDLWLAAMVLRRTASTREMSVSPPAEVISTITYS
jgi:hypothetical protein